MKCTGILCETGEPATVTLKDGRIDSVEPGITAGVTGGPDVLVSPGFFDMQVNGYAGRDFNTGMWEGADEAADSLAGLFGDLARSGTAISYPTVVTNSFEAMSASLKRIAAFLDGQPGYAQMAPGIHVEGPYFSPEDGPRGAHPLACVRNPDYDEFLRFQEAAQGRIKLHTLAPERPGALAFIEKLAGDGIVVAIGHTAAAPETIRDAVRAGATLSTHLGNGAHSVLPRHPNYIWEQLACDGLYASIIADGHHLPAAVVKSMVRGKTPERLALVSDAVSLGGMPAGVYSNGLHEVLPSGKIVLAGTPYLAGAGHLLDTCVANAWRFTDLTAAQAALCASAVPARIMGMSRYKGSVRAGFDADLTLFRPTVEGPAQIVATICAGRLIN